MTSTLIPVSVNALAPTLTTGQEDEVDQPGIAYNAQVGRWNFVDALLDSTDGIRRRKEEFLPKEPNETDEAWAIRVGRSFLFEAYASTLDAITSFPFAESIEEPDEQLLPEPLKAISNDADGAGRDLTSFFRERYKQGINHGIVGTLVDSGTARTRAEEAALGSHPFFVPVDATNLIGWEWTDEQFGRGALARIRVRDVAVRRRQGATYAQEVVDIIRLWERDRFEVWERPRESGSGTWKKASEGPNPIGEVPFRPWYSNYTDPLCAKPPFLGLAYLNAAHLQTWSDKRNLVRKAAITLLHGAGVHSRELPDDLVLGQLKVIRTANVQAKLEMVESSGSAIGLAEEEIKSIEDRMQTMSAEPFLREMGNVTATAKIHNRERTSNQVEAWDNTFEDHIRECFELAAEFTDSQLPEDARWQLKQNEVFTGEAIQEGRLLLDARLKGEITPKRFLLEMVRRGILNKELDVSEELLEIAAEQLDEGIPESDPNQPIPPGLEPDPEQPEPQPAPGAAA